MIRSHKHLVLALPPGSAPHATIRIVTHEPGSKQLTRGRFELVLPTYSPMQ
jgi:hypothetical protein